MAPRRSTSGDASQGFTPLRPTSNRHESRQDYHEAREHPQRCHHRARRPRQNHHRRSAAVHVWRIPRKPAGGRARAGQQRPGARARHHHPVEEHLGHVQRGENQRHRYAGPRRLRRRGGARAQHGRRRVAYRGRVRGAHATDAFRAETRPGSGIAHYPRREQDRSSRFTSRRSGGRGVRPHGGVGSIR